MLECLAEVQRTSERASSDICLVNHEARVQAEEHDRRLAEFLRQLETARTPAKPRTRVRFRRIPSRKRRGSSTRAPLVATHPECAHRGLRQHRDPHGLRAQHVAAHRECAHSGNDRRFRGHAQHVAAHRECAHSRYRRRFRGRAQHVAAHQ